MKNGKPGVVEREKVLLDEVHRTEEEIDLFLEGKKREADLILQEALQRTEELRERITKEALEEKDRLRESLIRTAEEDAEKMLKEGSRTVEKEKVHFDEIRSTVTKKIVDYLLGRDE